MMIRALTAAEAALAASLIRAAFAALDVELIPPPSALGVTGLDVAGHVADGGGGALYGRLGCVLWVAGDGALHLSRLAVLPEFRGQGVAAALLAEGEAAARAMGLRRVCLQVRLALKRNRRLFRRAGFVEGELHAHPGFDRPTFVSAEKVLIG